MLSITIRPLAKPCKSTSGGVARVWIFDPEDFTFTQAVDNATTGPQPYTAIALREDAVADDGAKMYPISFNKNGNEAEYTYKQSRKGSSVKYEHQLDFFVDDLDQMIAQWNKFVDDAGACGGIGLAIQLNSGKIFIAGEKWVGANPVNVPLLMRQDGSSGTSGKLFDDANGQTTMIKGNFGRPLYEFTGGLAALTGLE